MFNRSFNTTIGLLFFVLLWPSASGQAQPPFQLRVNGTCAPGSSIRVINADGSVVCQVDTNSGGTVTSVSTGSGLTGGPITTSGTISIATGGVTSALIADGTVGAVNVNPAQVQLRVTGTCAAGSAIQAVNQTGSVSCQSVGSGTVTAVTASAPLVSSGGPAPNISLPYVIIDFGLDNTAIGFALRSNTTGSINTAIGGGALLNNTTGGNNTASGVDALLSNTTGNNNTASGASSLAGNTTGNNNTASGVAALGAIGIGNNNTASGFSALSSNTTGNNNTASGVEALISNTTGSDNTAIGFGADVSTDNLNNATALGAGAVVDTSNKIRLGNGSVTVVEGAPYSTVSDQAKKENFQPVDGEEVLRKLRGLTLTSWNYIGHDPKQFRHYGPMGQAFFAAFGHDAIGTIGSPTTLTASDLAGILMSAVQAMEKRTVELREEEERLKETVETFKAENAALKARLERLERTTTTGYAR